MAKPKKIATKKVLATDRKKISIENNMNGKAQKLRINIKRSSQKNLNQTQDQNVLQSCYVKLKRISYNSISCNALPAQCNANQNSDEVKRKDQSTHKSKANASIMTRSKTRTSGIEIEKQSKSNDRKSDNNMSNMKEIMIDRQQNRPNSMLNNKTNCVELPIISPTSKSSDKNSIRNIRNFSIRIKNCGDLVSSNNYAPIPVIDDNKRKNFQKLSLTKSFKKGETLNDQEKSGDIPTIAEKKSSELVAVKQIPKLSLKKRDKIHSKNVTSLRDVQFEVREDSTICFGPARNSTLLNGMKHLDKNKSPSSGEKSFRNLANKSEEIEYLLNTLDDEEEILSILPEKKNKTCHSIDESNSNKSKEIRNDSIIKKNKSKIFFHREQNITPNSFKDVPAKETRTLKNKNFVKKRLSNAKRSTIARRENVYDFLSQSQISDSDVVNREDPSAEVIKKLIEQGKVQVATNCKGKGKPILKRVRPKAKQKIKSKKPQKTIAKKVAFTKGNKNDPIEENRDFEDLFGNDEYPIEPAGDIEMQSDSIVTNALNNHISKDIACEPEGTFSRLARSVLINQAGRSNPHNENGSNNTNKNNINFISTPKNKKVLSPQSILETDISPIARPFARPASKPSPWRVNDNVNLPTTFNFSRSSANLPSFSSDFIPPTPKKDKSNIYLNWSPNKTSITCEKSQTICKENNDVENAQPQRANLSDPSVISSFSSNDSNAENMPPARSTSENCNENENIFNLKHLPNPRRTLSCRSPLKTINIIEVVQLPPYKHPSKTTNENEKVCFDHNLDNPLQVEGSVREAAIEARSDVSNKAEKRPEDDLFGFEDYLSQTNCFSEENIQPCDGSTICRQNQSIYDKLHDLRKLKPEESQLQKSLRSPVKSIPLLDNDDTVVSGMKQRGIKEMLCSTMIHQEPSTSKEALRQLHIRNLRNTPRPKHGDDTDVSELFKDLEPETTFNENEAHRTYIRPHKRKRRLKESKYLVYLDSDESGDENSYEKEKCQHSKESNSSSEQAPKKKRQNKEPKKNPELIEFVEEFNKLCKDVDSYQLIVEKVP